MKRKRATLQRLGSLLLACALVLGLCPAALAEEDPETGHKVTFTADHATVDVYYTQAYTTANETNVTTAYARSSSTGEIDISGDGQVNFKVNVEDGYELVSVEADANYKNLKDSADTGVEGIYRLTKITGNVTVTITTRSVGSEEPIESEDPAVSVYTVTFDTDVYAVIDVYYTQSYETPSETNVTTAIARDSKTGEVDISGDGQVNFKVTVDEGYELASISADANYKNLKGSDDTGVEGIYRLTKVTGDVTVTVTTQSTGSGEPAQPEEPTYTPVVAADTRVTGCYDATSSLKLELAGRYNSGAMNADGGSLEIVEYNPVNGFAYAVSGVKGKLIAVDLNNSLDGETVVALTGTEYDVKSLVSGFSYGDMTSVAISPDGTKLAVAIQAEGYADNGVVALFACNTDGSLELLSTVTVGVQPDMVTFADNSTILSADEGEPRDGAAAEDPKGSVTIVSVGADNTLTANTVTFDSFDAQRDALTAAGVLVQKNTNPSTDFEPEYIAVSGSTAYVSLQEANAIAVLDIPSAAFAGVYSLGFQDYSVIKVDLQKNDTVELSNYENVCGIKMPDGIAVTTINGKTYLLTANEGDSRADWDGLDNESESKTSPTGNVTLDNKVVWFNAGMWDGLDADKAYVFGSRSFSIYEVTDGGLTLVYDSGSGFEEITAEQLPAYFNTSNDKNSVDNRSGKKGPEPESVVTGIVDGRTYAFIALERISGVMVYDVTDPAKTEFVNYINSREFEEAIQGEVSPEGLCFVSAVDSKTGNALLLTACEVSGTLAVYELTGTGTADPGDGPSDEPDDEPNDEPDNEPADNTGGSGGSSSSSGGSSSDTTTETTTNANGSTTTTVTDKTTGTVTETTTQPVTDEAGTTTQTVTETVTNKDGTVTVTETVTATDTTGTTAAKVTETNADGETTVTVEATVSEQAVAEAAGSGEPVILPVKVAAAPSAETAAVIKVEVPAAAAEVKVEVPVENVTPGTVVVLVREDGTEEIVKATTMGENGVVVSLDGSATVKIVDNSRAFADVQPLDHWADEAVTYVAAREIFSGTGADTFEPETEMTRAMLMTVLARYAGADTTGGATWYEKGMEWAVATGVSDGTNPNASVTREQMAVMLYRYAGSPASSYELTFPDAGNVSDYAVEAMRWAVENGLFNGMGDGTLAPQDSATRTQVATILMRFIENT